jgi:hypothetical protein
VFALNHVPERVTHTEWRVDAIHYQGLHCTGWHELAVRRAERTLEVHCLSVVGVGLAAVHRLISNVYPGVSRVHQYQCPNLQPSHCCNGWTFQQLER